MTCGTWSSRRVRSSFSRGGEAVGGRARGVAPDWLRKAMADEDVVVNEEAHKTIVRYAGDLSYAELVVLLHRRVGLPMPYWFTDWFRKRHVFYAGPKTGALKMTIMAIAIQSGSVTPWMMMRKEES